MIRNTYIHTHIHIRCTLSYCLHLPQGIEHVLDSATWFLRDPITMGTRVAFLRPFTHQQLVVHCSANIPLQLDPESTISTPNLRFQAI